MELTEEQKITMAVAYGRVHEAAMQHTAQTAMRSLMNLEIPDTRTEQGSLAVGELISEYNEAWRKLTGFRPHWEDLAA